MSGRQGRIGSHSSCRVEGLGSADVLQLAQVVVEAVRGVAVVCARQSACVRLIGHAHLSDDGGNVGTQVLKVVVQFATSNATYVSVLLKKSGVK